MRDRKPTLADRIAADVATVRWAGPGEIRARARRRTRRTVTGYGLVLLLVAGGAAPVLRPVVAAAPPVVAASSPPVAVPSPRAEIPPEALLQAGDLPEKSDPPLSQSGLGEPVRVSDQLGACRRAQGLSEGWETSLVSRSQTLLRERPDGYDHPPGDVLLGQDVYRVAPELAVRFLVSLDALVAPCAARRIVGPVVWQGRTVTAEAVHSWTVTERNFAGDEAVLLRHAVSQPRNRVTGEPLGGVPRPTTLAIVRVGDLVTVINVSRTGTDEELRRLGRVAATRMCRAANPGC